MSLEKKSEFKPLPRHVIEGDLNIHYSYTDEDGGVYSKRVSRDNPEMKKIIHRETRQWGFNREGGKILLRTEQEQREFEKKARDLGLRVLAIIPDSSGSFYRQFLEKATTLDEYLPSASGEDAERVLKEIFDDLSRAHQAGIVYGDRWPKNILVDPKLGVINIDFDLELQGPAKELELAQVIFYGLALDEKRSSAALKPILKNILHNYDYNLVKKFVTRKARKSQKKYGDLREAAQDLFEELDVWQANFSEQQKSDKTLSI
jgi:tRNA A-37 threonylcarbamoyl transferase component Bud32